ncbi:copper amine oxidase N-terminal domain-containing protein [Paenibacillus glycanilyticus]|uniref:Copper amine oxidase-like N-terminal domain-containing protein n=1 Tax=Paenibacillus glycanilyticus TaxID=126569 RepID=A0ABQ6GJW5_9BACL|nr:copper amine oxidase N-terminal domain-containing protein [Paenibacillus glycanilyticus]GLX70505.1 hypothetical protein MU1_48510 [Paenibacillus glycanilyticus]
MKKLIAICVIAGMLGSSSTALAAETINIKVKDKLVKTDTAPVIDQGRVLVPLRTVSESLGATVEWKQQQKTVVVAKWSKTATMTVGKKTVRVDNKAASDLSGNFPLDVTVKMINNRVYVPLRFISEQLGYKVYYKDHTVSIQSPYAGKYNENYYAQILSGDLGRSRMILKASLGPYGLRNYEHTPIETVQSAANEAYLFPEGEALRCFLIENNETITFFEYKDDFVVATWQAHVEQSDGNAVEQLLQDKLKDRTGPTPTINKPFFYNYIEPWGNVLVRTGRIDPDGTYTELGYRNDRGEKPVLSGTISNTLPNEVRNEFIKVDTQ